MICAYTLALSRRSLRRPGDRLRVRLVFFEGDPLLGDGLSGRGILEGGVLVGPFGLRCPEPGGDVAGLLAPKALLSWSGLTSSKKEPPWRLPGELPGGVFTGLGIRLIGALLGGGLFGRWGGALNGRLGAGLFGRLGGLPGRPRDGGVLEGRGSLGSRRGGFLPNSAGLAPSKSTPNAYESGLQNPHSGNGFPLA